MGNMKTTMELPDDLMRAIKLRAVLEDKKLKDIIAELLRSGLEKKSSSPRTVKHRVKLPLIYGKPAAPGEELTPERVAQLLIDEEAQWAIDAMGR